MGIEGEEEKAAGGGGRQVEKVYGSRIKGSENLGNSGHVVLSFPPLHFSRDCETHPSCSLGLQGRYRREALALRERKKIRWLISATHFRR